MKAFVKTVINHQMIKNDKYQSKKAGHAFCGVLF